MFSTFFDDLIMILLLLPLITILVSCSFLLVYEISNLIAEGRKNAYLHFFDEGDDDDK